MLEKTKPATHSAGRFAVSVLLAGALLMPAFPLSEVVPAHADPAPAEATEAFGGALSDRLATEPPTGPYAGRLNMDVPLDGTLVVAQGQTEGPIAAQQAVPRKTEEEKRAILDGYLADGTITEDDLDNEFIVSSLTGSYLEQDSREGYASDSLAFEDLADGCGDCLDEEGGPSSEVEERLAQDDEAVQAALEALAHGPTYEDVVAAEEARRVEEEAAIPHDESLASGEVVTRQPYAASERSASAAAQASSPPW